MTTENVGPRNSSLMDTIDAKKSLSTSHTHDAVSSAPVIH